MASVHPGTIVSIFVVSGLRVIETVVGGKYVYEPSTDESLNDDEDPEWRRNTIAAHAELAKWIPDADTMPCPAHIGWNARGQPLLEHHGIYKAGGAIQPFVAGWDSPEWLRDPCCPHAKP